MVDNMSKLKLDANLLGDGDMLTSKMADKISKVVKISFNVGLYL